MRLEKIKLAGFKSFVDPTTIPLPSNLVGVVGPNGCGKSNVIDAVRWVMGESSPRLLRGESMADVIFNGSSTRKPINQAVVELLFNNQDGSVGGQYASFNEISVKRQVTRDGTSTYLLNGTRCRRRDVTDLFRGTGLGPRSYSIIEQGTISRMVEARPEELRAFLEEAAGISKYKERRRETATRIHTTRENLERLQALRDEVAQQAQRLERQAAAAEKYTQLQAAEQRLRGECLGLRARVLEQERVHSEQQLAECAAALATILQQQHQLETVWETQRAQQPTATEYFNRVQEQFYALGAEITRVEQALQFQGETQQRQRKERAQAAQDLALTRRHWEQDAARLTSLQADLAHWEPELVLLTAVETAHTETLEQAAMALRVWQDQWETFNQEAAHPVQQVQVERTRLTHLEQQELALERRRTRLQEEWTRLEPPQLELEIAAQEQDALDLEQQAAAARAHLLEIGQRIQALRAAQPDQLAAVDQLKEALQTLRGRQAALLALQQAAGGTNSDALATWLTAQGLDRYPRLMDQLVVSPNWRLAVETVLGAGLYAHCTATIAVDGDVWETSPPGPLQVLETAVAPSGTVAPTSLAAQASAAVALDSLLGAVHTAVDLKDALKRRHTLAPEASIITPQGAWVGRNWLRWPGNGAANAGVLERAAELKTLAQHLSACEQALAEASQQLAQQQVSLHAKEEAREAAQAVLEQMHLALGPLRAELSTRRLRYEYTCQRQAALSRERAELDSQLEAERETLAETREQLHRALAEIETLAQQRATLVAERERLRTWLDTAQGQLRAARERLQQRALAVEAARSTQQSVSAALERLEEQLAQLEERQQLLEMTSEQAEAPLQNLRAELTVQQQRRQLLEPELAAARHQVETLDLTLRATEQTRQQLERSVTQRRGELDRARFQHQEIRVRLTTLEEQLQGSGFDAPTLWAQLPPTADLATWETELEKVRGRLQRLGPVNLAALSELQQVSERKEYLEAQHADISAALTTLEDAIRKIDRETRSRFKETFDKVNAGLHSLFPRLFGGGRAVLELTGADLLEAGVTVKARPPGKRNSSIHLLSGGEKALTAVALVFAIFQLNPAPFCMLDEVDAPLDDANVERFCELVKWLSDQVQFIFITHNKVTMELASQLIGVTMHEPGVSRPVSVDVDAAVQLVAV